MSVQPKDPISIGSIYRDKFECRHIVIAKNNDKENKMVCICSIGTEKCEIIPIESFRHSFTNENPIKTWVNEPQKGKFYGAHFVGGTRYGYDWITNRIISKENEDFCKFNEFGKEQETIEEYFKGNGKMRDYKNNYEIVEFETMEELLDWLNYK